MARLELHLLGPPELALDGQPATGLASDKVRALLFYLTVEADRAHRRESLAGLLWPDYPDRSARTNLSNALSNLRTALGDREADTSYFHISRAAVQFNAQSDHWVDSMALDELVARAEWESAIEVYRGSFLEGFSLADSPPFEQWALVTRERLQRQVMAALEGLTARHEARGDYARAIDVARRQLEIEPWNEGAHRAVMRSLALNGQRAAALAQYEACARALRQELGAEPSAETEALYVRIRDGELAAQPSALRQDAAAAPAPRPHHNLPIQLTLFVGREGALAQIGARLADPACRLLSLIGPGGSGKTRLALEAASRQLDSYPDGAWFVPLAPLQSPKSIVPTVAQALGLAFYPGGDPRQQLLAYLREKRLLLILDNYEHLLAETELVADVLRTCPGVKIAVTSRVSLGLQGEHLFPVEGMDVPREEGKHDVGTVLQDGAGHSAVRLFAQTARLVQPEFALTDDNVGDVIRVCRLVDGMPLAIVLAAAWAQMPRPDEIADEIRRSLDFLGTDL